MMKMKTTYLLALLLAMGGTVSAQDSGIISHITNNAGNWCIDDVIMLPKGGSVRMGPQGADGDNSGKWTWTGPANFKASVREVNLTNLSDKAAGIYTVKQQLSNGTVRTHDIKVYVDGKLSADEVLPTYPENAKADLMYEAFNKAFLYTNPNNKHTYYTEGWNQKFTGKLYCWEQGLNLLMLMDRYRFRGDEAMKPTISMTVDALNADNSGGPSNRTKENGNGMVPAAIHKKYSDLAKAKQLSDWTWNEYNDDLLWMSLPNIRAYLITGEKRFLEQAKWTWDYMNERGWDGEMGGGYWWCIWPWAEKPQCKSGLSNNPAICLSAYLYEATGDEKYLNRAKEIFEWVYAVLRDATGNNRGRVDEGVSISHFENNPIPSRLNSFNVYNQGPFIEGAAALYRITGDERYFKAAKETMDWVMINRVNNNGLMEFNNKTDGTWQSEYLRGFAFLMETRPELWKEYGGYKTNKTRITYYNWLRMNANAAYDTRETVHNLSDCAWDKQTVFLPDNKHSEMWVGSVIAQQVTPAKNPWNGDTFTGVKVDIPEPENILPATAYAKDEYGWWQVNRLGVDNKSSVSLRAEADIDGTWSWSGPGGKLSSTTNEVTFDQFTSSMSGNYTATCTASDGTRAQTSIWVGVQTTVKPEILPYVSDNDKKLQPVTQMDINSGKSITFAPQVANAQANEHTTWQWKGPNGFTGKTSQVSVNNMTVEKAGKYTVTFTDMFGRHAQAVFDITVDGVSGISDIEDRQPSAPAKTFDLQGRQVKSDRGKGIFVVNGRKLIRK